jgi:hypothetical protein
MIRDHFLAFDDRIPNQASVYTSEDFAQRLGIYDSFAVQVIVENKTYTGPGTLTVAVEHSGDAEHYVPRSATPEINAENISDIGVDDKYTSVNATSPLLPYVRFRIQLGGLVTAARVKLYVVVRDPSG